MNKMLIIIIAVVVLLAGGGGAAYFFLAGGEEESAGESAAVVAEAAVEEEEREAIYLPLDPAFVVNFEHNGSIRYLQLSLQVMSYEQAVLDKVQANMPAVRNTLILLFSGQNFDELNTLEGKEALRLKVKDAIQEVVHFKKGQTLDDVFFTGFVMQ
ncbi:MAG: flagellar basal body-associated FliL family protein [Porticoccaceae bacterium]